MNPIMTNTEFHEAWNNLSFNHHAPNGYWDKVNEQRKNHRFAGRKVWINEGIHECIRAEDDLVVFSISTSCELIVSGDEVANIKWIKG